LIENEVNILLILSDAPHQARNCCINFYLVNGAVIAPEFGDLEADETARKTLLQLFPGREVIQLNIDALAAGGGGIHCVTQQEPHTIT
jgi:agmatine deiminase